MFQHTSTSPSIFFIFLSLKFPSSLYLPAVFLSKCGLNSTLYSTASSHMLAGRLTATDTERQRAKHKVQECGPLVPQSTSSTPAVSCDTHCMAPDSMSYFQTEILLQMEIPLQTEQQDKTQGVCFSVATVVCLWVTISGIVRDKSGATPTKDLFIVNRLHYKCI